MAHVFMFEEYIPIPAKKLLRMAKHCILKAEPFEEMPLAEMGPRWMLTTDKSCEAFSKSALFLRLGFFPVSFI